MENERQETANSVIRVPKIWNKLLAVSKEIEPVEKKGRNKFYKYNYIREEDLINMLRPILNKHGLVISSTVISTKREEYLTDVLMRFAITDTETGEQINAEFPGCGEDKSDKALYKAMTGATKYFLYKFFCIPSDDDPENDRGGKTEDQPTGTVTETQSNQEQSHGPSQELLDEIYTLSISGGWSKAMITGFSEAAFHSIPEKLSESEAKRFIVMLKKKIEANALIKKGS